MDKKNITPEQNQPINRITSGQLPAELAEFSEEILQDEAFAPALAHQWREMDWPAPALDHSWQCSDEDRGWCSFDGDDAE